MPKKKKTGGGQGNFAFGNSLDFQAHIEDLHLKYCIPKENVKTTTSGRKHEGFGRCLFG